MENIEVHSKSFVIRWVHVSAHTQITWNVLPTKRSINFGVYSSGDESSPSSGHELTQASGPLSERLDSAGFESLLSDGLVRIEAKEVTEGRLVLDKAQMLGFVFDNTFSISNSKLVRFAFNIEQISPIVESNAGHEHLHEYHPNEHTTTEETAQDPMVSAAAAAANSALYARRPSNTHGATPKINGTHKNDALSSSAASAALYSSSQPSSNHRQQSISRGKDMPPRRRGTISGSNSMTSTSNGPTSPILPPDVGPHSLTHKDSNSASNEDEDGVTPLKRTRQGTFSSTNTVNGIAENEPMRSLDGRFFTGFLQKKRRKQFQGFARRYFSSDKRTGLLNYYLNNRSSSLRGVMPIRMSEIKRDPKNPIIYLNSGMEKWASKSNDPKAFEAWWKELKEVQSSGMQDESELESEDDFAHHANSSATDSASTSQARATRTNSRDGTPVVAPNTDASTVTLASGPSDADSPTLKHSRSLIETLPQGKSRSDFDETYGLLMREANNLSKKENTPQKHEKHQRSGRKAFGFNPRKAFRRSPISEATITRSSSSSSGRDRNEVLNQFQQLIKSRNFIGIFIIGTSIGLLLGFTYSTMFVTGSLFASVGAVNKFRKSSLPSSERDGVDGDVFAGAYSGSGVDYGSQAEKEKIAEAESLKSRGSGGSDEDDDFDLSDESDEGSGDNDEFAANGEHGTVSYVPQRPCYDSVTASASSKQYSSERDKGQWGTEDPEIAAAFSKLAAEHKKSAETASEISETQTVAETSDGQKAEVPPELPPRRNEVEAESAETSLYPLPHDLVHRRSQVPSPIQAPPSSLALLKNAKSGNGTAPIISNEPLSGVETTAELFENSDSLAAASKAPPQSNLRSMLVASFSVARLSTLRCKERVLRKPFTPLLGETFEMVREDREFRFIAEKVMHKPEVIASQAESPHWTAHFTSRPHSKMWAKSMQLSDVGHFNVTFPDGEGVSFNNPESFVRNIIGGERYVEPTGTITVESNKGSHSTATVEFKAGGMFSGRSEEVKITSSDMTYEGKWTEAIYHNSKVVWSAKPLVEDPHRHYGWTVFTAQMNEITPIEDSHLPPNDSRCRPDLRLYEEQTNVEKAEEIKLASEQRQRERRKKLEDAQKQHEPFFFVKSHDSKGLYVSRKGERNYWVQRKKHDWSNIPNYFQQ